MVAQAYVHCKAGRGRSGAVVMAYIVASDMQQFEHEQWKLLSQDLTSPRQSQRGGATSASAAAALSSQVSLAARALAAEVRACVRAQLVVHCVGARFCAACVHVRAITSCPSLARSLALLGPGSADDRDSIYVHIKVCSQIVVGRSAIMAA